MKFAIIEDRIVRLKRYTDFELMKYESVNIITGSDFDNLIGCLKNSDTTTLDKFDCIASHRSALSIGTRDTLKEYCRKNRKPLIFFSGGISSSVLKDIEFPFLHINSKEFYSENLNLFIDACEQNNAVNLLLLQFGKKWKLSLLLNLRNNITVAINKLVLKEQFPNVEIDDSEMINRVRDLQINSAIKDDLVHENAEYNFLDDDLSLISFDQIHGLKDILDRLIKKMG